MAKISFKMVTIRDDGNGSINNRRVWTGWWLAVLKRAILCVLTTTSRLTHSLLIPLPHC